MHILYSVFHSFTDHTNQLMLQTFHWIWPLRVWPVYIILPQKGHSLWFHSGNKVSSITTFRWKFLSKRDVYTSWLYFPQPLGLFCHKVFYLRNNASISSRTKVISIPDLFQKVVVVWISFRFVVYMYCLQHCSIYRTSPHHTHTDTS